MKQILDSESDIPPTSSHKQLWHYPLIFTSDLETITEEEESSESGSSDNKTNVVWCKTDLKNQAILGTTSLNIVMDNPESVVEVVIQSLVMILSCYILNSLICSIVRMHNNRRYRLKHWNGPVLPKEWERFWE